MRIDEAIKKLQYCKEQWADRVVVCSKDRDLWGNLEDIELIEAYWKEKPGDAVINGDFTNPFTKEEYEALVRIISFAGWYISLDDEPLLNDLGKKMQWWVNFYELIAEDTEN
jgi:hypothetical protein